MIKHVRRNCFRCGKPSFGYLCRKCNVSDGNGIISRYYSRKRRYARRKNGQEECDNRNIVWDSSCISS